MNQLLPLSIDGQAIRQDEDGRYCINDLHSASGGHSRHKPANFLRSNRTRELVSELEKSIAQIRGVEQIQPLVSRPGAPETGGGTFVCKELVYAYAMWISPAFHLKVIRSYDQVASGYVLLPKDRYIDMLEQLSDAQTKLVRALEKPATTQSTKAQSRWTAEEIDFVREKRRIGWGARRIARPLGRTMDAVESKIRRMEKGGAA